MVPAASNGRNRISSGSRTFSRFCYAGTSGCTWSAVPGRLHGRHSRFVDGLGAFAAVAELGAELVIAGDGERDRAYAAEVARKVATTPALAARVRLAGALDDRALAAELARAGALVLPSLLEGYGMVLGEALFAGVPVIAADRGAAVDLVAATRAGLLFDASAPAALCETLRAFVRDAALRERLRRAAAAAGARLPKWGEAVSRFRETLVGAG